MPVSSPPEQVVRHSAWARHDLKVKPVEQLLRRLPQPRSGAELHLRGDRNMEGVDEVGVEELPDDGRSATEPDILALGGLAGALKDCGRITVDEVKSSVRQSERRAPWCVITNTGVWKGGSSPHQPCHS